MCQWSCFSSMLEMIHFMIKLPLNAFSLCKARKLKKIIGFEPGRARALKVWAFGNFKGGSLMRKSTRIFKQFFFAESYWAFTEMADLKHFSPIRLPPLAPNRPLLFFLSVQNELKTYEFIVYFYFMLSEIRWTELSFL